MIEASVCTIAVSGEPAGQPRAKAWAKRMGGKAVARMYTPDTADSWKRRIYIAAGPYAPERPHMGPVRVDTTFYFARPPRLLVAGVPDSAIPYDVKPDRDNLDKAVLDALSEGKRFWIGDEQVYGGNVFKYYVARGSAPGAVIRITLEPATWSPTERGKPRRQKR